MIYIRTQQAYIAHIQLQIGVCKTQVFTVEQKNAKVVQHHIADSCQHFKRPSSLDSRVDTIMETWTMGPGDACNTTYLATTSHSSRILPVTWPVGLIPEAWTR